MSLCARCLTVPVASTLLLILPAMARAQVADCARLIGSYGDAAGAESPPYSLDLRAPSGGRLVYLGSVHSRDPHHRQFAVFERIWKATDPTRAFYEGGNSTVAASRDAAIKLDGEPGLVRFLATRDHVPLASLEPDRQAEIDFLLKTFSPEQVKLFYVLRVVAEMRDRDHASPSDLQRDVRQVLDRFGKYRRLDTVVRDPSELEEAYHRYWTTPAHWWDVPAIWFDPRLRSTTTGGVFTNEVNRASSTFRDIHMFELLAGTARSGQRVFAVVGRDHIPMQEAALRCALK